MKSCITCSMPFVGNHAGDIGLETPDGPVCIHDCKDGKIKGAEEVFEGGVQFFMHAATSGDRGLAERLCRKNMRHLPYWQQHPSPILEGAEATDQEFGEAMAKL